jgi:hypothetical protein
MAKKVKIENTDKATLSIVETPKDENVIVEDSSTIKKESNPLEKCTVRDLLELSEVALILGKKYENLTIAEGSEYFSAKQKYNDFYDKIIKELEHRVETQYMV